MQKATISRSVKPSTKLVAAPKTNRKSPTSRTPASRLDPSAPRSLRQAETDTARKGTVKAASPAKSAKGAKAPTAKVKKAVVKNTKSPSRR